MTTEGAKRKRRLPEYLGYIHRAVMFLLMVIGLVFVGTGLAGFLNLKDVVFGKFSTAARDTSTLLIQVLFGGSLFLYAVFELLKRSGGGQGNAGSGSGNTDRSKSD